ncbi:MAG: histidine kinase [bacterium]|nr:histidine kinase [bacterium]
MRNSTLGKRLVSMFLGMILFIILVISVYYFTVYENGMEKLTARYAYDILEDTVVSIDKGIENLVKSAEVLVGQPDIQKFLEADNTARLGLLKTVRAQLSAYIRYNQNIQNVFLVDKQGSKVSSTLEEESITYSEIWMEYQWISKNYDLAVPFRSVFITPHHDGAQRNMYFDIVLPVYKDIAAPKDSDYLGSVIVVCNRKTLDGILPNLSAEKLAIMEGDSVLFSNNAVLSDGLKSDPLRSEILVDGKKVKLVTDKVTRTGWRVCLMCTRPDPEEKLAHIRNAAVLACIMGMFVLVILFRLSFHSFVQPMEQIVCQIREMDSLGKRIQSPKNANVEFSQLTDAINHMLEQNEQLNSDIIDARLAYYRERMLFLQTQINPHFLYNNLQCIRGMSARGNAGAVRDMVTCIADIYRYGSVQEPETTLAEEYACLEMYSKIIRIRYDDCYNVQMECGEEAQLCRLPRMCLQPLVENSILHGFNDANLPGGRVDIRAGVSEGTLWVEIRDNGGGMSEERVRWLNTPNKPDLEQNSHLGVENVRSRLHILFGEESLIQFESAHKKGTCVKLFIKQK